MMMTLKAARVNAGMNQHEAAKIIGVSVDTISQYERGRTFPDVPIIKKITAAYGVNYDDIDFCPKITV